MLLFGKEEKRVGFKFIAGPKYLREAKTTQHTPIPLILSKISALHLSLEPFLNSSTAERLDWVLSTALLCTCTGDYPLLEVN